MRNQLFKRIKHKEDMGEKRASIPSAKVIEDNIDVSSISFINSLKSKDEASSRVCKVCYQGTRYPVIPKEDGEDQKMKDPSEEINDSHALYTLIHCRGCFNTVHWNCIGTDVTVLEIKKGNQNYYFFECDLCRLKASTS